MAFTRRGRAGSNVPVTEPVDAPEEALDGARTPGASRALTERLVERTSSALERPTDRRSVLRRAALVGSAVATGGVGYILRPGTAYASVCGDAASCSSGWTAFCCTVHGLNTCPPSSFPAGWWKIDASPFCDGQARYIVDCNATCPTRCSCRCASGTCDERRVCCNQFRYGQCNTQIACAGPVVCRVALCTPPWVWSSACTTTSRTDNRTLTHNAPCLPSSGSSGDLTPGLGDPGFLQWLLERLLGRRGP